MNINVFTDSQLSGKWRSEVTAHNIITRPKFTNWKLDKKFPSDPTVVSVPKGGTAGHAGVLGRSKQTNQGPRMLDPVVASLAGSALGSA